MDWIPWTNRTTDWANALTSGKGGPDITGLGNTDTPGVATQGALANISSDVKAWSYSAQALPVSIWRLRNFVATAPRELEEAAAVDGAGPVRIFFRILFPLVPPGLIATSVFAFITAYNDFIVALTFLGQAHGTYRLPIYVTYFFDRGGAQWGPIMAASTLFTIPVVVFFLLVQRRMTAGLVAGAVKG